MDGIQLNLDESEEKPYFFDNEKEVDFDDDSTINYSAKSVDTQLDKKVTNVLSDFFDSDTDDVQNPPPLPKLFNKHEPTWESMEGKGALPAFECSKYIPKIGPKEFKPEKYCQKTKAP
jgi:hypothetical protein